MEFQGIFYAASNYFLENTGKSYPASILCH